MFKLPMLVVTWSRKATSPIMREDDPRQAGPLRRGPIGAEGGGAGTVCNDTAGGHGRLDGVVASIGGGGVPGGGW